MSLHPRYGWGDSPTYVYKVAKNRQTESRNHASCLECNNNALARISQSAVVPSRPSKDSRVVADYELGARSHYWEATVRLQVELGLTRAIFQM